MQVGGKLKSRQQYKWLMISNRAPQDDGTYTSNTNKLGNSTIVSLLRKIGVI